MPVAFWLSLGPIITSKGVRVAGDGLYWWFYQHVPGFDGLRVPARMGMLVVLFLAVLGGYGARAIERRSGRPVPRLRLERATAVMAFASVLLVRGLAGAHRAERDVERGGPEAAAGTARRARLAARHLPRGARAAANAVIAEFPFGDEQ